MGFLLAFAFELCRKNFNSSAKYCMIFGFMAGGLDELHQYFVPGRTMDIFDFIADITGIITGIIVWLLFAKLLTFLKSSFLSKKA
jgi:VanZ family protein